MKEGFRQAMAWLHTWAGLIFGWLLFAIFLTGTLAYFKGEITHWMQPEVPAHAVDDARSVAVAQSYLEQHAPTAARWFIGLPNSRDPGLSVMWQDKVDPGRRGNFIEKMLDPVSGEQLQARETMGGEFFYRFHFQLQMPHPWGRWLSTIAAMVMFVALITGIITHKKIFKDFFTFRPRKGQRSFIEYLLQSPNQRLREQLMPDLLSGKLAGATGLSNAMKFLSGIETLQISAEPNDHGWILNGRLHWVTNLRKNGFVAAAAIEHAGGGAPFILAIPDSVAGLQRSRDLELLGLQSSNTAALGLEGVELSREWLLHEDARKFLPAVRPAFLGLQCGMSIGLARRSLAEVAHHLGASRTVLRDELEALRATLDHLVNELEKGLLAGRFTAEPIPLFKLRIALAETAASAVQLELQASGGKAYLTAHGSGFARRWRESAFVPIVTPSLVQLRTELHRQASL